MNTHTRKPFLQLLDSYILDAIDQLDDQQKLALVSIQPKLASLYGLQGSWQEIVRSQMDFPDSFPDQIRKFWEGYLSHAKQHCESVNPNEFVISFVNQNFPDISDS
jgi:hypothetical protein